MRGSHVKGESMRLIFQGVVQHCGEYAYDDEIDEYVCAFSTELELGHG